MAVFVLQQNEKNYLYISIGSIRNIGIVVARWKCTVHALTESANYVIL